MEPYLVRASKRNDLESVEKFLAQLCEKTISVLDFIEVIKRIKPLLDVFGVSFKSLSYELVRSIEVVQSRYNANECEDLKHFCYLDVTSDDAKVSEAIMWIYRCLCCLRLTFCFILNARKKSDCVVPSARYGECIESLTPLLRQAYMHHFRIYHSWFDQQIFKTLSKHCPSPVKVVQALQFGKKEKEETTFARIASFEMILGKFLSQLNDLLNLE